MPLNALNKINIENWNDPEIGVAVRHEIAKVIENASWEGSKLEPFIGRGEDRGIRTYKVEEPGVYQPRLQAQLTGDGVVGNADFDTNLDQLAILSQAVYPKIVGNSMRSEISYHQKIKQVDFIKQSTIGLTKWISDKRDKSIFASLINDLSNVVVADATNGIKDSSKAKTTQEATQAIVEGDVLTMKTIKQAILMARVGKNYKNKEAFPIKPVKSNLHTYGGIQVTHYSYIILLDSYQIQQLQRDPEWINAQKVGLRGDKNNLFSGIAGVIDDCPVIDMGVWSKLSTGLANSTISDSDFNKNIDSRNVTQITPPSSYAKSQPVSIGFLIGASAVIMAGADTPTFYIDDKQDLGRKTIVGVDRVLAIAKAKFKDSEGYTTAYNDSDFAVIGIASSME
ncbi:DUF4043 family protein [Campylobacter sp. LR264d]|uniref:phage capsid family protein n=1 Tax=Campylobacter sp. LR264d TaxID=2593544 RepID=UPI0012384A3D|nr:DUF4043 family protein [Campylobacter sp. LR264d]KAA6234355.1 DUF4043 family protein [Campylobacter sp. LR264d]